MPARRRSARRPAHLYAGLHRQDCFRSQLALPLRRHGHRKQLQDNQPCRAVRPRHTTATARDFSSALMRRSLKTFRVISTQHFWSDGDGRLSASAQPLMSSSARTARPARFTLWTPRSTAWKLVIKNTLLYAYYGADYIGRNVAVDANGTSLVGYGYAGSANSQNRIINEITFGFNQTVWRNPRYGAVNFMGQYEWLQRSPWFVAANAPKQTHDNTIYFDVRYTLPGAMPNF